MNRYQKALEERREQQLLRTLQVPKATIDFCSNDYLGLAKNKSLQTAIAKEIKQIEPIQTGSTGSRLLSGNHIYTEKLETKIAAFHHTESALIFGSGYTANIGLISCVANQDNILIMDELCHASLIDGARLSKAQRCRFKHNDLANLEQLLQAYKGNKIVVIESIYSMDGDICPLREVATLCEQYDAKLIVDEAHAIGVLGTKGAGLCNHFGLMDQVFACVVTYGKAMGCHGAAVLGKQWLKDYLVNFCRAFIFTTAPAFHQLAAIKCSYDELPFLSKERLHLQELIQFLNTKKTNSGFQWLPSDTQIQAILVSGNQEVMQLSAFLLEQGIDARGIRYPSVAKGKERIRICLHSYNTKADLNKLLRILKQWKKSKLLSLA